MSVDSPSTLPSQEPESAASDPNDTATEPATGVSESALLGGARPEALSPFADLEEERRIAADPSRSLEDRLEAFEDIMDSEVGDTSLTRARNVERQFGIRQLYLKFDGGNPTGTQKDRIAFAQVKDSMRRGFDSITVATCGNYGAALALAASVAGLRCVIFVPSAFHTRRRTEMDQRAAEICSVDGDYELRRIARRTGGGRGAGIERHYPGRNLQGLREALPARKDLPHPQDGCRLVVREEPDRAIFRQGARHL
jgi:hypothetical protein